jgi:hypothetical protein
VSGILWLQCRGDFIGSLMGNRNHASSAARGVSYLLSLIAFVKEKTQVNGESVRKG